MLRYGSYGFYSASPLYTNRSRSQSSKAYRSDRYEERIKKFRISSAQRSQFNRKNNLPFFNSPDLEGIEDPLFNTDDLKIDFSMGLHKHTYKSLPIMEPL